MVDLDKLSPEDRAAVARRIGELNRVERNPLKYRNRPTIYQGIRYASQAEAKRATELDLLVRSGEVAWWLGQIVIPLGDIRYRIDFLVAEVHRLVPFGSLPVEVHAEDVKGVNTSRFQMCKKLWSKYAPFDLHVIRKEGVEIVKGK